MRSSLLILLLLSLLCITSSLASLNKIRVSDPDPGSEEDEDESVECIDPSPPQATPSGSPVPVCSVPLLQQEFRHTLRSPPAAANFTPPEGCRWSRAVLEFAATCDGDQVDRIAAVWLDGVELLRTSTAMTVQTPLYWRVRKDVTRFSSLLLPLPESRRRKRPDLIRTVHVMLENSIDATHKGVYHVNVTLDFYGSNYRTELQEDDEEEKEELFSPVEPYDGELYLEGFPGIVTEKWKLKNLLGRPADMVIPVSNRKVGDQSGFWFRIENESDLRGIRRRIPRNAYKAVLEICLSFHGDDEFWYSNPPDSYFLQNNLPSRRGNWAFRELILTIDGLYAGSVLPFPVIFPGGINPLMWTPVVAIKAFDLPTYDLDLTPFLGNLLNGKPHSFNFQVSYSLPFWLVNANLHLWLDPQRKAVPAMTVKHHIEPTFVSRNENNKYMEGHFQLEAARQARFEGWVRSSLGNFTSLIDMHFKYKSSVEYKLQGVLKDAYSQSKYTADLRITERPNRFLARVINEKKFPLRMISSTEEIGDRMVAKMNLSHIYNEFTDITLNQMRSQIFLTNMQIAGGVLQKMDDGLTGSGSSLQTYQRRDNGRCHTRKVTALNGGVTGDQTSTNCNMLRAPRHLLLDDV